MLGFLARGHRYLWTDAFAVCNCLSLGWHDEALRLIDRVHQTLGRRRSNGQAGEWLGLASEEHPTRGGLRIGKHLPERRRDEPFDERLEWERDGQYFHYLTRWMHALSQASRWLERPQLHQWAVELAETAQRAFLPGLWWKMSVDLTRPLVLSTGHHDPLDGFLTLAELGLAGEEFALLCRGRDWTTSDPLGLGGLLLDLSRMDQLRLPDGELYEKVLASAEAGLRDYAAAGEHLRPARLRLPYREFGLSLGLRSLTYVRADRRGSLERYLPLADEIESFWRRPGNQSFPTWVDHLDINEVMLASSLAPEGVVRLSRVP